MDPCGKLGDCSFSHFDSIMRSGTYTHIDTHRRTHTETDTDERFTPTTLVGVSNYSSVMETLFTDNKARFPLAELTACQLGCQLG